MHKAQTFLLTFFPHRAAPFSFFFPPPSAARQARQMRKRSSQHGAGQESSLCCAVLVLAGLVIFFQLAMYGIFWLGILLEVGVFRGSKGGNPFFVEPKSRFGRRPKAESWQARLPGGKLRLGSRESKFCGLPKEHLV